MFARRVMVVGTGYVGLTTGACLASLGHEVVCADIDAAKVDRLRRGVVDIVEPGLSELVSEQTSAGRLSFVVGAAAALGAFEADDGLCCRRRCCSSVCRRRWVRVGWPTCARWSR